MAVKGYPLDKLSKRSLEVGLRSRTVGRVVAYLLNRSGERLQMKVVAGGAAGNITVTGVSTDDRLVSVIQQDGAKALIDLTGEFTITAANTINNTGGTNTTGHVLVVTYADRT